MHNKSGKAQCCVYLDFQHHHGNTHTSRPGKQCLQISMTFNNGGTFTYYASNDDQYHISGAETFPLRCFNFDFCVDAYLCNGVKYKYMPLLRMEPRVFGMTVHDQCSTNRAKYLTH